MRWLVVVLPVFGAGAAIIIGLARIKWPQDYWETKNAFVIWAIIVAGVVPVAQSSISEFGEKRRRKQLEREDLVRSLLVPSLVFAVNNCSAPWDRTGIQAFLFKRRRLEKASSPGCESNDWHRLRNQA